MINAAFILAIVLGCVTVGTATNGTVVDNSATCDYFATRTTYNATHDLCECGEDLTGNGTICALQAQLDCSSNANDGYAMKVFLNQTYIDYYNFTQASLVFSNESCGGAVLENGYYVLTTPNYDACGSVRTNTSTQIIYSNVVKSNGGGISTGEILDLPVSCMIVAFLSVSLGGGENESLPILLMPDTEGTKITFPVSGGEGSATAQMFLYQDANYNNPYNGIPVLQTTDMLYAEIALESPIDALSLISRECWATPDITGSSSERFDIVEQPGCLNTAANNAKLTSNGGASYSRFEFQVFTFMPSNLAYLHCDIELCYTSEGRTCTPSCGPSGRRKRSTNSQRIRSSAIIRAKEHVNSPAVIHPVATTPEIQRPAEGFGTDTILYVLLSVAAVLFVIIGALFIYMCVVRRRKSSKFRKTEPLPEVNVSI